MLPPSMLYRTAIEQSGLPLLRLARSRGVNVVLYVCVALLLLVAYSSYDRIIVPHPVATVPTFERTSYEKLTISGFANAHIPDGANCTQLRLPGSLEVSKSLDVPDNNIVSIAESINHPAVNYTGLAHGQDSAETIAMHWHRMAGSSVWLEEYGVFFTVTRIYFYKYDTVHPTISFLRAQIHDANWNHMEGYKIEWRGDTIAFPYTLDLPIPYKEGGRGLGTEDPRVLVEPGTAEPIIIFNMMVDTETGRRAVHAFRPFSNLITLFQIEDQQPKLAEKNWSPFFLPRSDEELPGQFIHFVYDHQNLKILRCYLLSGVCSWVYRQNIPPTYRDQHKYGNIESIMRGGTNFEPITLPSRPGLSSFVGFPRTNSHAGCSTESMYRPELMVLTTNGTHFWIDYLSEALSFGHSLLTQAQIDDACDSGRILLSNGIARFDGERDELTATFTVADATVQVATVRGVQRLVEGLPQFKQSDWRDTDIEWQLKVTHDVLLCSTQTADDFALANTTPSQWEEKQKDIARKKAEAEKQKEKEKAAKAKAGAEKHNHDH